MKKIYSILILSFLIFAILVSYYIQKQEQQKIIFRQLGYEQGAYGQASFELALFSLVFIIFTSLVAILGIQRLKKTSRLLLFSSIFMGIWSVIMAASPRHISVDEVALAWYGYIILTIILGIIGIKKIDGAPIPIQYQEDILDDL